MLNFFAFKAYVWRVLSAFLAILCILFAVASFGKDPLFDRIYYVGLLFTLIICRKNINVVMLVFILLIERTFEELVFLYVDALEILWVKLIAYAAIIYTAWYFRHDRANKLLVPFMIILSIAAEVYWFNSNYSPPVIVWYLLLMCQNLIVRYMIFMRYEMVDRYFSGKATLCFSEFKIRDVYQVAMYLMAAMTVEYFLRHVANINSHIVYNLYSYLMQGISTFILWCILQENLIWLRNKKLTA